jgi:hypothetical protein
MTRIKEIKFVFLATFILENTFLVFWRIFQPTSLIVDQAVFVIAFSGLIFLLLARSNSRVVTENSMLKRKMLSLQFISSSMLFLIWVLLVPGTVERSRSLAIFKWVQFDSKTHTQDEIEKALQDAYNGFDLPGFRLRLHEHRTRGLMRVDSRNQIELTIFGEFIYNSAEITAFIYRLNGWYDIPLGPNA